MSASDEWGPWTEHVPGPCPVPVGTWIQTDSISGMRADGVVNCNPFAPFWVEHSAWRLGTVIRYRVRIDREYSGMSVLRELLKGVPTKETEDA